MPGEHSVPACHDCVIGTRRLLLLLGREDDEPRLRMLGGLRIRVVNEKVNTEQ